MDIHQVTFLLSSFGVTLILLLFIIVLLLLIVHIWRRADKRARMLFESWKRDEFARWQTWIQEEANARADVQAEARYRDWQRREEQKVRQDAIRRSQSVIRGKITEHLIKTCPTIIHSMIIGKTHLINSCINQTTHIGRISSIDYTFSGMWSTLIG